MRRNNLEVTGKLLQSGHRHHDTPRSIVAAVEACRRNILEANGMPSKHTTSIRSMLSRHSRGRRSTPCSIDAVVEAAKQLGVAKTAVQHGSTAPRSHNDACSSRTTLGASSSRLTVCRTSYTAATPPLILKQLMSIRRRLSFHFQTCTLLPHKRKLHVAAWHYKPGR